MAELRTIQSMTAARMYLVLLVSLSAACAPELPATPPTPTMPAGGESWIRPADQMAMVFVPPGEFMMGSSHDMAVYAKQLCEDFSGDTALATCKAAAFVDEQPAHLVRLEAFWIDRLEVTNSQYETCVQAGECDRPLSEASFSRARYFDDPAYDDYPVINVTWQMASQYCAWASAQLPTEAQWEYAARGRESRVFPWGNTFEASRLNYCDASCALIADPAHGDGYPDTAPVGSFSSGASWIGALDMAGNVREWVSDWYGRYPSADVANPGGPEAGELKITRGGAWYDTPDDVRSTNRGGESLEYWRYNLGFRCARNYQ